MAAPTLKPFLATHSSLKLRFELKIIGKNSRIGVPFFTYDFYRPISFNLFFVAQVFQCSL